MRETMLLAPSGVPVSGDVEVHLRASDFERHGHSTDAAYADVVLHLCWVDDRSSEKRGRTPLPPRVDDGAEAPVRTAITVALADALAAPDVERLVRLGPVGVTPCSKGSVGSSADERVIAVVRAEGRRRLAEMTWRAWRLADRYGFAEAFEMLVERAVASSAGRVREDEARRHALVWGIVAGLGVDPLRSLAAVVLDGGGSGAGARVRLIGAMQAQPADGSQGLGVSSATEVAWNAVLPLLAAWATAYGDISLARVTAGLAEHWPAPRPYGRTQSLAAAVQRGRAAPARGAGALWAQGLLHLQDIWCTRGGCGVCPLSPSLEQSSGGARQQPAQGSGGQADAEPLV